MQNNGQPLVVYAYPESAVPASAPETSVPCSGASQPSEPSAPAAPSAPASDLDQAQAIADQSAQDQQLETLPQSDQPCRVETNTEVVQQPGETFVHHPGPIYINQPPTRLVINHAPFVIRPSPIALHQGGRTITKEYTKKFLPSPIQVRPIIVRIVKPIEKKVLIEKATQCPQPQSYVVNPVIPDACATVTASPAPCATPATAAPPQCSAGNEIDLSEAGAVELQAESGDVASSPCGCGQ